MRKRTILGEINMSNMRLWASACGLLLASGCALPAGEDEELEPGDEGEIEQQLPAEMTSGSAAITYASRQYYTDPDVSVNQWAEASFNGTSCNGVMIGPNVYLTAAHCGAPTNVQIRFRTYRNGSTTVSDTETFTCNAMLQTFNDTDGAVFFCGPNAAGENPGDKYGYVDFDLSTPTVGQQLYSISANPWVDGSVAHDARMYATGQVTSVSDNGWFVPNANPNSGIAMNLWGETGMSGSPHFNPVTHRMIIAPLSVAGGGVTPAPRYGGWYRAAVSMQQLLYWGYVNPDYDPAAQGPTVNVELVRSLGLVPESYYGWADKELDYEFDVQRDLERLRGEARRGWYWLGFESQRRNALWDPAAFTSFDTTNRWARLNKTGGPAYSDALLHRKLNLSAGTYRVSLMTFTHSAAIPSSLWVSFKQGASYIGGEYVPNTVGSGWQMHTLELTSTVDNAELVLGLAGNADVLVSAMSIVRQGDVMNFDTFDKRFNWRNDINGSRAQVVPDGAVTGTPNWAVRVAAPPTAGFPVRNRQLALAGGRSYQICFDARRENASGYAQGHLRVMSGGAQATSTTLYASSSWLRFCTLAFTPPSDDNNLQARLLSGDSSFLIDNIAITQL